MDLQPSDAERNVRVDDQAQPDPAHTPIKSCESDLSSVLSDDTPTDKPVDSVAEPSAPGRSNAAISLEGPTDGTILATQGADGKIEQKTIRTYIETLTLSGEQRESLLEDLLPRREDEKPLIEFTIELPTTKPPLSRFEPGVLCEYREKLASEGLVFISCPDEQLVRASACAIVEAMGLMDGQQRRLLDFERIAKETSPPNIYYLRKSNQEGADDESERAIAIVVEALNSKAQEFLDLLMASSPDALRFDLKRNHIFMLCLVDPADIQARLKTIVVEKAYERDLPFPHWQVPFLQPLLEFHFPGQAEELERKILERRDLWYPDDKRFWWDLRADIKNGTLRDKIESPQPAVELPGVEALFSGDDPVLDTVVYVATFFPNLNPREFQRVVRLLLGERTKTITVSVLKQTEDGKSESVEVQHDMPLVEIWQESMDKINRQCSLVTVLGPDATRTVDFKDHRLRARLRQYLEEEYAFFLTSQFERLLDARLLFDPSARVGVNMIELSASVAASDPDYYGKAWLGKIIAEFECELSADGSRNNTPPAFSEMLAGLNDSQANYHVYQRITGLIRTLLERHQLKGAVDDLLEQLVRRKLYGSVLEVGRRLRFTTAFDEFYWLKQLLERGDKTARLNTFVYLYRSLRSIGARVYQILTALDSWVARQEAVSQSPSASGTEALRLMVVYGIETTASIEPQNYGAWPTRHPLFAFRDIESAKDNLELLARWLFHPWMKSAFPDDSQSDSIGELIAALTLQWILILIGPSGSLAVPLKTDETTFALSAGEVQRILIEQIVASANPEQQSNLLASWQALSRGMIDQIKELSYASEVRDDLIWKRNLLEDLMAQFRDLVAAKEKSMQASSH